MHYVAIVPLFAFNPKFNGFTIDAWRVDRRDTTSSENILASTVCTSLAEAESVMYQLLKVMNHSTYMEVGNSTSMYKPLLGYAIRVTFDSGWIANFGRTSHDDPYAFTPFQTYKEAKDALKYHQMLCRMFDGGKRIVNDVRITGFFEDDCAYS
jgi:hypothetical protein